MSRKLFAGFVGREEGWRRELRGSLGGRRPWRTAVAVPGERGALSVALVLRRGEGRDGDVVELAGRV